MSRFVVVVDTREQQKLFFPESNVCSGMIDRKLETGDYSIEGLEDQIFIDRKKSTAELMANVCQKRFFRELERAKEYRYRFIVTEFPFSYILTYPVDSSIPKYKWQYLKTNVSFLLKKIKEIEQDYKVTMVYSGSKSGAFRDVLAILTYCNEKLGADCP